MKNIYVLPTTKPSRLSCFKTTINDQGIDKKVNTFKLKEKFNSYKELQSIGEIPYNVYITCDKEIEEQDIDKFTCIFVSDNNIINMLAGGKHGRIINPGKYYQILLTNDKTLIADGIQDVNDEFLKWFVENSSCRFIKIDSEIKWKSTVYDQPDKEDGVICKMRLPKEFKQEFCDNCNNNVCLCVIKNQETLEETAERMYPINLTDKSTKISNKVRLDNYYRQQGFIEGVTSNTAKNYWYKIFKIKTQ